MCTQEKIPSKIKEVIEFLCLSFHDVVMTNSFRVQLYRHIDFTHEQIFVKR